jgi:hypothetical protein
MEMVILLGLCLLSCTDRCRPGPGYEVVATYAVAAIPWRAIRYRQAQARLAALISEGTDASA